MEMVPCYNQQQIQNSLATEGKMSVVNPKVDEHKGSLNILSDQVASRDDSISEEDKKMKNMELIKKSVERHKKLLLKLAK